MNRWLWRVSLLAGLLPLPVSFAQNPGPREKPVFAVELKAEKAVLAPGETAKIVVSIRNQSDKETYAVGSLDGSDVGWRWPVFRLRATDAAGQEVAFEPVGRCGNMNPLRREDFVRLKPGAAFDPLSEKLEFFGHERLQTLSFAKPGTYKITLTYDTRLSAPSRQRRHGDGEPTPELEALIRQVPEGVFTSEPLALEVK